MRRWACGDQEGLIQGDAGRLFAGPVGGQKEGKAALNEGDGRIESRLSPEGLR